MTRIVGLWVAAWCGAAFLSAPAVAQESFKKVGTVEGITEYVLPNGLRVLLFPDASKPKVTVNLTIFCGSRHEGYGETGMAHLLEHMVFKGTPTFPDVPKALRDHGANFNGTTWVDRTNYFETMPATDENLEFGIQLEADRMVNSLIRREDLLSEMTVVRNEFEAGENSPEAILSQRMMAVAYEWHNYGKSTIGNRSDIERVPVENLQAFYRKFYQPDNAMLVVAGKFDEKKALEYTVKYFGKLKRSNKTITNTYTEEPAQDGERQVNLRRVGTSGATGVIYHIPSGSNEEFAACQLLEDVLTSEPNGRVYKALVESKKAASVSGSSFAWHDPGIIEITAKVEKAEGVEDAKQTLIDTVENLAKSPVTQDEVDRSKLRFKKYFEQLTASSDRLAIQLSEWAGAGDWRLFFLHRDRVEKVTADDVNKAAAKYLRRNNRTVGVFIPTAQAERVAVPGNPDLVKLLDGYKGRAAVSAGESFDPSPDNIEARVIRGSIGTLKTAFLSKKTRGEMVDLTLNLRFGNEQSLNGMTAAAQMVGDMLPRGTAEMSRKQITDTFDKLGARVSFSSTTLGVLNVTAKVKRENLAATLKLIGDVLREPNFPAAEFTLLQNERIEDLNTQKSDPIRIAVRTVQQQVTGYAKSDVRYVPTFDESIERIKSTTVDHVRRVYQSSISAAQGELAVVGDFDPNDVMIHFGLRLTDWRAAVPYKRIETIVKPTAQGKITRINTPDKANAVYIGATLFSMSDTDPEYAALQVANYLLGGAPLASRLSNKVRGELGLSYGVGSGFDADAKDKRGSFQIFAITNPENMGKVETAIDGVVEKFVKDGVSLEELEAGKKAFLDRMRLQRSEDSALAAMLANSAFNGRTTKYVAELEQKIAGLAVSDVQKAVQKFLDSKKLVIVEAGDFEKGGKKDAPKDAPKTAPKGEPKK